MKTQTKTIPAAAPIVPAKTSLANSIHRILHFLMGTGTPVVEPYYAAGYIYNSVLIGEGITIPGRRAAPATSPRYPIRPG